MQIILMLITLFFAVIGLAEIIHFIRMRFLKPLGKTNLFSVLYLDGDNAEDQLRYAGEQMNWDGAHGRIATYDQLSKQQESVCRQIARQYDIVLCPIDWLNKALEFMKDDSNWW